MKGKDKKVIEIQNAIEIVMKTISVGLVSVETPEKGADLYDQLTFIVSQVKKEMFWKRIRLWAYGPIIFSHKVFSMKSRRFKKISKACKYLLRSKKLRKYLDDRALMYLFNESDPYFKPKWTDKPYCTGDKDRDSSKKDTRFNGCFDRLGKPIEDDETYNVVKVVTEKDGKPFEAYKINKRKKTPMEITMGISPFFTTVVVKNEKELVSPDVVGHILDQITMRLGIELDREQKDRIEKRVVQNITDNEAVEKRKTRK